jgi:hypothetical protein
VSTTAETLRAHMRTSIVGTELQHTQVQLRLVCILLAGSMFFDMVDPAMLILGVPSSVVARVAGMTHQPVLVAWLLLASAGLMLPFALLHVFHPGHPGRRDVTRAACLGLVGGGLLWIFLGYTARNTDFPYVVGVFLRTGAGAFLFALALAISLNSELARTLLERE